MVICAIHTCISYNGNEKHRTTTLTESNIMHGLE